MWKAGSPTTMTPMARAMPVRDMMLEDRPKALSKIKLMAMVMGIWMIMLRALRQWNKNRMTMRETASISSPSLPLMLAMAAWMRLLRS